MSRQPPGFVRREVLLAPETEIAFHAPDWRDALVFIASGALEVDIDQGARARFETGAILCLDNLRVRSLRNAEVLPLVIIAVSRPDR